MCKLISILIHISKNTFSYIMIFISDFRQKVSISMYLLHQYSILIRLSKFVNLYEFSIFLYFFNIKERCLQNLNVYLYLFHIYSIDRAFRRHLFHCSFRLLRTPTRTSTSMAPAGNGYVGPNGC